MSAQKNDLGKYSLIFNHFAYLHKIIHYTLSNIFNTCTNAKQMSQLLDFVLIVYLKIAFAKVNRMVVNLPGLMLHQS
jgi:hypothetical protein